ncbi:MAG: hypothetical protein INR69_03240 [Mucilaginibacter polytrichastri]|nr:hypothetical protein [Mucilaginibacter polytrichastri]
MKNLSDNDFDDLFRRRVDEFETDFDDSAWNTMEHRLKRRDRIVFVRKAVFTLVFLLLLGGGSAYLFRDSIAPGKQMVQQKKTERKPTPGDQVKEDKAQNNNSVSKEESSQQIAVNEQSTLGKTETPRAKNTGEKGTPHQVPAHAFSATDQEQQAVLFALSTHAFPGEKRVLNDSPAGLSAPAISPLSSSEADKEKVRVKKAPGWSFTFSAGPDFSAVSALGGQHPKLQAGILANYSLNKRLTFSSGIRYGLKQYATSPFAYQLGRPELAGTITYIDGSCNVLEVPLRASYAVFTGKKSQLLVNGGLSSYFMLRERYAFEYTPESGRETFILNKNNANQHLFGVTEISATYTIKPKNSPVQFGIEPYLKLPLTGVGEGRVKLNSTGVNLNISYGFKKK